MNCSRSKSLQVGSGFAFARCGAQNGKVEILQMRLSKDAIIVLRFEPYLVGLHILSVVPYFSACLCDGGVLTVSIASCLCLRT